MYGCGSVLFPHHYGSILCGSTKVRHKNSLCYDLILEEGKAGPMGNVVQFHVVSLTNFNYLSNKCNVSL